MSRPRVKQMIAAVTFCVISLGLILAIWVVLVSGGGGPKAASAAPNGNSLTSSLPNPNIGPVGAMGSVGGMPALNTFAARQLPAAMHVQATLSTELLRGLPEPRLVRSFPSLSGGYIRIPVFIPGSEGVAAADQSSRAPVGGIILLGSAAGWSYLALSGSDRNLPGIGHPYRSPSGAQPAAVVNPASNPGNPAGITVPGYTVARNNPGNAPGNNPPGNNNQGDPPGDKPGNSGNQGGNSPGNSGGNNGGNAPGGPPGYGPGNNPGNSGNNPGNSSGNNAPNGGNPPILPDVVPDDLPVTTTPEPVSLVLLGSGLAAVAAVRNRRRKK